MSTARYVIEGNVITKEEIVSSQMVTLEGLLPHLTSYIPVELAPIPDNCKYLMVKPLDNMGLSARILVTHDPMMQRINHKNGNAHSSRSPVNYRLAMPYGIFWFNLSGNRVVNAIGENIMWTPQQWGYLWSNVPFTTVGQTPVWAARLPNCWSSGAVCFGSTNVQANQPLGHFINAAINTFWTSEFNNDLSVSYPYATLKDWEIASANDPNVWQAWDMWSGAGRTLKDKLEEIDTTNWTEPIPSSTDSPIPPLRILPTFWNLRDWLDELSDTDRARLRAALDA